MTNNIDKVSAEAKALIGRIKLTESEAEQDRKLAQPLLRQVWDALEAKQPVAGCKTKAEWAKYAGTTTRTCQYILKDGSRKRTEGQKEKEKANRTVRTIKSGDIVKMDRGDGYGFKKYEVIDGGIHGVWLRLTEEQAKKDQEETKAAIAEQKEKKKEEKKPIKHAKNPKAYGAWCRTRLTNANTAHQQKRATCPYCIAAMEADVIVNHPETDRRWIEKQLKDYRPGLKHLESLKEQTSPEYRDERWKDRIAEIPERRKQIAEWEQELAGLPTTPEEAVAQAKEKIAIQEADRAAANAKREGEREAEAAADQKDLMEQEKVKVKLTEAQAREVGAAGLPINVTLNGKRVVFHGNYGEDAKALVLTLEKRIERLNEESAAVVENNHDLYFESDMGASAAAREIKKQVAKLNGASSACRSAIRSITFGAQDDESNILEWYEERERVRDEEESARWKAESDGRTEEFVARREKAEVGWEPETPTTWKNADGRFIYKTSRKEEYKVYAKGTKTDTPMATVTTLKEAMAVGMKMHPAAEALAAVVGGSPDCPTDEEVL